MVPKHYIWDEECQGLLKLIEQELGMPIGDKEESLQYRLGAIKETAYQHRRIIEKMHRETSFILNR